MKIPCMKIANIVHFWKLCPHDRTDKVYQTSTGTGAQDCCATIAFITTQALNYQQECRIVKEPLIKSGLLDHLWSIDIRQKAFSLISSYLSDRYLFVVANGQESSLCISDYGRSTTR